LIELYHIFVVFLQVDIEGYMTIAHVVYGLSMGGIETMLVNISHFQAERGHDVHIVVINDIFDESILRQIDPVVKLHKIGRKRGSRNPWPVIKMNLCLIGIKPDVIHLHSASISRYVFFPGLKSKLCNTLHAMCNPDNTKNISKSGPIFAISGIVKKDINKKLGLKATIVRNGINPYNILQKRTKDIDSVGFKIVQVARLLHETKGQDILIKATKIVISKGHCVELTLIGEGPSMDYLKQLASDLGISKQVIFLGNKPQEYVFSHLADFDLLVQPSRFEGFGLTVAEAMAARLPVLVSDNDGPMEIIDYGKYGTYFRCEDTEDCADKIVSIMNDYPTSDYLDKVRDYALTKFNVKGTANKYLTLYESLIIGSSTKI